MKRSRCGVLPWRYTLIFLGPLPWVAPHSNRKRTPAKIKLYPDKQSHGPSTQESPFAKQDIIKKRIPTILPCRSANISAEMCDLYRIARQVTNKRSFSWVVVQQEALLAVSSGLCELSPIHIFTIPGFTLGMYYNSLSWGNVKATGGCVQRTLFVVFSAYMTENVSYHVPVVVVNYFRIAVGVPVAW